MEINLIAESKTVPVQYFFEYSLETSSFRKLETSIFLVDKTFSEIIFRSSKI